MILVLHYVVVGASALPDTSTLKVFVLAGQSNMEGQAEINKTCTAVEPGKCAAVGAPMNGTLVYQLSDPRTAKEFAPCWDAATNNWTVLPDVKLWFNEKGRVPAIPGCPLGCPTSLADGSFGNLTTGFGSGGFARLDERKHIGPEYGFGFAMNDAFDDEILIIKTAWGGKTLCIHIHAHTRAQTHVSSFSFQVLSHTFHVHAFHRCGDFRPPSRADANHSVGFYYTQMLQYVA